MTRDQVIPSCEDIIPLLGREVIAGLGLGDARLLDAEQLRPVGENPSRTEDAGRGEEIGIFTMGRLVAVSNSCEGARPARTVDF